MPDLIDALTAFDAARPLPPPPTFARIGEQYIRPTAVLAIRPNHPGSLVLLAGYDGWLRVDGAPEDVARRIAWSEDDEPIFPHQTGPDGCEPGGGL